MTAALVIEPNGVNIHFASAFISQYEALRDACFDLRKPVGRQYLPHPRHMGVPHDEVQVFVFARLLANKGVDTQPPSSHTSAPAARSHPRISTTSAPVIVISEPYRHTVGGEPGAMYVREK
jgi:hypothetical protein